MTILSSLAEDRVREKKSKLECKAIDMQIEELEADVPIKQMERQIRIEEATLDKKYNKISSATKMINGFANSVMGIEMLENSSNVNVTVDYDQMLTEFEFPRWLTVTIKK